MELNLFAHLVISLLEQEASYWEQVISQFFETNLAVLVMVSSFMMAVLKLALLENCFWKPLYSQAMKNCRIKDEKCLLVHLLFSV